MRTAPTAWKLNDRFAAIIEATCPDPKLQLAALKYSAFTYERTLMKKEAGMFFPAAIFVTVHNHKYQKYIIMHCHILVTQVHNMSTFITLCTVYVLSYCSQLQLPQHAICDISNNNY